MPSYFVGVKGGAITTVEIDDVLSLDRERYPILFGDTNSFESYEKIRKYTFDPKWGESSLKLIQQQKNKET